MEVLSAILAISRIGSTYETAAVVVGGGGVGGVVCRYVSATVMFCLRELTETVTAIYIRMKSLSKLLSPLAERNE